jgi:hypothetical protein
LPFIHSISDDKCGPPKKPALKLTPNQGISGGINFMRRVWPIGVMIVGARLLLGSFMTTTAKGESFFDYVFTPIGLILVVGGGYFFMKDFD